MTATEIRLRRLLQAPDENISLLVRHLQRTAINEVRLSLTKIDAGVENRNIAICDVFFAAQEYMSALAALENITKKDDEK